MKVRRRERRIKIVNIPPGTSSGAILKPCQTGLRKH
jgi:hypothetical protein